MDITGKVHCFFEQSGTFKNEFIKLGIPAEDYDIQNNYGETITLNLLHIGLLTQNQQTDLLSKLNKEERTFVK